MKGLIINGVVGVSLFAGALVGGLAATGRLNHEGVANIPILNGFFPEPPPDEAAEGEDSGEHATEAAGDASHGTPVDAHASGAGGHDDSVDASHDGSEVPQDPKPLKRGRSIVETEEKGGGGHGGGHGEEPAAHGEEAAGHGDDHAKPAADHGAKPHAGEESHGHAAEDDLHKLEQKLSEDRKNRYSPGGYFRFDGMPAGVTPTQLNEACKRVEEVMKDLERREKALELREKELEELADDISRRQTELGRERTEIQVMQLRLDERIDLFKQQVMLVHTDEIEGLRAKAQTFAKFEPQKSAEIFKEEWNLQGGQERVLKTLALMNKEAADLILVEIANMDNQLIRDILDKRLKVSVESQSSATPNK